MWPVKRALPAKIRIFTVFCRHQGANERLNMYMTSNLCVRKIFRLQRVIGKGRQGLRNDEDLMTGSYRFVGAVTQFGRGSATACAKWCRSIWQR